MIIIIAIELFIDDMASRLFRSDRAVEGFYIRCGSGEVFDLG